MLLTKPPIVLAPSCGAQGRMHRLLGDLGDPHHAWPVAAHVAGTKGKGSTVALLSSILLAAGYKAGAYTRCGMWQAAAGNLAAPCVPAPGCQVK